jgi:hypothetical protein
MTDLPTDARDTFLAHFPQNKRGTLANWFLEPIRERRATTPRAVLMSVLDMLRRRLSKDWVSEQSSSDATHTIAVCSAHEAEALAFAAYYLSYAQLPDDERNAIKQSQREEYKAVWMAEHPPTEKQLDYLRGLGYTGDTPTSRQAASEAIDRLVSARGKAVRR